MFPNLVTHLQSDIQTIKEVLDAHDLARTLFYSRPQQVAAAEAKPLSDPWAQVNAGALRKSDWQIYDYCAALSRLYAVYAIFVEELVSEYLRLLPELYDTYPKLPEPILKQHRVGFGQILLKLGEAGRYGHLKESDIVSRLFNNISGEKPYSLLREAFFVDRQNYRSDVLARTLGYIGIENAASRVATSPAMTDFLENNRPGTTFESELNRFVKLRNEAAHSQVGEVVGIDELKLFADFLLVLCRVLADIVSQHVYAGRNALGQLSQLGVISHVYEHGRVVIARVSAYPIRVGEEVLVARAGKLRIAKIRSIQLDGISVDNVHPKEGQEVGLGLETDTRCREGALLYRTTSELANAPTTPTLFTAEELAALEPLQADESEDEALGEEPLPEEAEEPNSEAQSE